MAFNMPSVALPTSLLKSTAPLLHHPDNLRPMRLKVSLAASIASQVNASGPHVQYPVKRQNSAIGKTAGGS
jgi:hypothetical protein